MATSILRCNVARLPRCMAPRMMRRSLNTGHVRAKPFETFKDSVNTSLPASMLGKKPTLSPKPQLSVLEQDPSRNFDRAKAAQTFPPNQKGQIVELDTFVLPDAVTGCASDVALGKQLIKAWRKEGILQIEFPAELKVLSDAIKASKAFFAMPPAAKEKCVDSQSFAGYIASGEEITDGIADYSEIFTCTKDLPVTDRRVKEAWPCHGPTPWPSDSYAKAISKLMEYKGVVGEKLLKLVGLGLGLKDPDALCKLASDGWHHMRVLRFPPTTGTNGRGKPGRGIGSHTDYGMLVIAAQDEVGGLFVRRPMGEDYSNWKKDTSAAGKFEYDDKWSYVAPVENVFTVFTGDMMQMMTNSYLPSTPHKVALNTRERFAFAYFHEPNFNAICKTFPEFHKGTEKDRETMHYGTHFSNMFMRNYPERVTAKRMHKEKRMDKLGKLQEKQGFSVC